jgi:hypothetical protein
MPDQYAATFADYQAALERAGVSEHTQRAYASRVAGYLRWLADTDLVDERAVGDPTPAMCDGCRSSCWPRPYRRPPRRWVTGAAT